MTVATVNLQAKRRALRWRKRREHLDGCERCRAALASIQRVLNVVSGASAPERRPEYGAEVWRRIEGRLPKRRLGWLRWLPARQWAAAGAVAVLLVMAFAAGRYATPEGVPKAHTASAEEIRKRIILAAVAEHLERSQFLLTELANATLIRRAGLADISEEQQRAGELLAANRIYRKALEEAGESAIAAVLDSLERTLLEVSHAAPKLTGEGSERLRERIEGDGLLFRIRVMGAQVREEQGEETL